MPGIDGKQNYYNIHYMKKIYPIILILLAFSGCSPESDTQYSSQSRRQTGASSIDTRIWGKNIGNLDFSGSIPFESDSRIDDAHKKRFPELKGNYVLWRMPHDGSCWVSAATTLLLYEMIEGGPQKFDEVVAKMRSLVSPDKENEMKDFFRAFETIRENLNHRFSLELRNHRLAYEELDKGMRMLLAQVKRSEGNVAKANEIETPYEWGSSIDFERLFLKLGLEYHVMSLWYGSRGHVSSSASFTSKNSLPKMMVIDSRRAYIDVLVDKEFSARVNEIARP